MPEDNEVRRSLDELKEVAPKIAFHSTLVGLPETEIADALTLSNPYRACHEHAAHEFLLEIVSPLVERGRAKALKEIASRRAEAKKLRQEWDRLKEERAATEAFRQEAEAQIEAQMAASQEERRQLEQLRQELKQEHTEIDRIKAQVEQERSAISAQLRRISNVRGWAVSFFVVAIVLLGVAVAIILRN